MRRILPKFSALILSSLVTFYHMPNLYSTDVILPGNPEPKQGEVFPVTVLGDEEILEAKIQYGTENIYLQCNGRKAAGWFGFDLSTSPGKKELNFVLKKKTGTQHITKSVTVVVASFPTQHISGVIDSFVNPGKRDLERIKSESNLLRSIWQSSASEIYWEGDFIPPLDEFKGIGFGRRRIINGEQRNPHTGVDAAVERGTPVKAINNGVVRLARYLFFSGISVIIDHGGGFFSMYFHLQDNSVEKGDYVYKGAVIGHAGNTGRATGPHLHLGVRIVNQRVNPMDLFRRTYRRSILY